MAPRLQGLATACGLAALLALGACSDQRASDSAARPAMTNEAATGPAQSPLPRDQAAARAAAQRSGSAELAQGAGS